jgi:hypothetical protein
MVIATIAYYPHNMHYKLSCNLHDNGYTWLYNQHLKHEIVHNSTKDGPFVWFHTRKCDAMPSLFEWMTSHDLTQYKSLNIYIRVFMLNVFSKKKEAP